MNPWLHGTLIALALITAAPLGDWLVTVVGG